MSHKMTTSEHSTTTLASSVLVFFFCSLYLCTSTNMYSINGSYLFSFSLSYDTYILDFFPKGRSLSKLHPVVLTEEQVHFPAPFSTGCQF